MKKSRRNHAPSFKAKVALEAAREEGTITEISRKYGVHANQVRSWKEQLLDGAVELFASGNERQRDQEDVVKDLHAKIGLCAERHYPINVESGLMLSATGGGWAGRDRVAAALNICAIAVRAR